MQKIIPNLRFNRNAKEAVEFYTSVFPNSKIISTTYYLNEGLADFQKDFSGSELTIEFELNRERFTAINAGDDFKFTPAISFVVYCKDQDEIDYYWEKLSFKPKFEQCGWCKDKYGLSWQIVPENMEELMSNQKKIIISDYES